MKKKFSVAATLLALIMAVTGCSESILTKPDTSSKEENIWTAADSDIVAYPTADNLTDEQKEYYNITFEEFYKQYRFICSNMGITDTKDNVTAQAYRRSVIEMLVHEKIILKKAEELGLDVLTEEEMNTIEADYQKNIDGWISGFSERAMKDLGITSGSSDTSGSLSDADQKRVTEKATELFEEYLESFGFTIEIFLQWERDTFIEEKVLKYLYKDVTVSDDEVEKHINDFIAEAEKVYNEDVSKFESNSYYSTVWLPEGTRNIKHVFIGISSVDAAEITAARNESGADEEEINKLRDEKLAEIKEKAEAAYSKATAETDDREKLFDEVLKEYSNDYNSSVSDQTITIIKGSKATSSQIYDHIFAIENPGDISELIPTDRGYYFFYYVGEEKITDEEIAAQKKNIYDGMLTERQNEIANKTTDEWLDEFKYEYNYEKLNFPKPEVQDTTSSVTSK